MLLAALFIVLAAGIGFVYGALCGAASSREAHYQECLRLLGYDPVAVEVGGLSGPIAPGDRLVLHPYCPERRCVVEVGEVIASVSPVDPVIRLNADDSGPSSVVAPESWVRQHAARFVPGPLTQK